MCLVVEYSKKLVKSDYLGVVICNWWRRVQKIGIFADQNAKYTENSYEDPKTWDFHQNYTAQAFFMQNTPKNWDIRCDFSKNREIRKT